MPGFPQAAICRRSGARLIDRINFYNGAGKPTVSFTCTPVSGISPFSVRFTDSSTFTPTRWTWNFGDGTWYNTTIASQKNPTHIYSNSGTYTAKLTACDATGCNTTIPGTTITVMTPTHAPSITVTSPDGGENWKQGSIQTITWSFTGNPGSTVKIELLKGGQFYQLLNSGTSTGSAGSGSYPWTIRTITNPGTDYKIRVTSTGNSAYSGTSNADFAISDAGALPVLTVTASPSSVIVGTATAVKFTVKNQTSGLVINGATVTLSGSATGSGVTGADGTVTISVNAGTAGTITATAIRTGSTNGVTTVTATASPGASSIAVISPNGGETWKQNTTHPVTWSYTGNPGSTVKIELLKNGVFYQLLTPGTSIGSAGSGSYSWTIRTITKPGTDYKIRVTSTSNSANSDTSNANFTIN